MKIDRSIKSPNFNARRGGVAPSMIVLHYTGMKTTQAALERLCDPASEVSAHYFIHEDGRILQLVEDDKRAWHAGAAYWRGETDINSHSIGIELVNPGHEFGYRPFPEPQIKSLKKLCRRLIQKHKIPPGNICGHSDIAPGRKQDPGELFPWRELARENIGIWPRIETIDQTRARKLVESSAEFLSHLKALGYNSECDFQDLVIAFHRRYCPEKLLDRRAPETPDRESAAIILSLLKNV